MTREYEELIERLGKLTGPDRGADVLIASAIDWEGPLVHRPVKQFIKDMGGVAEVVKSFESGGLNAFICIPHYTSSIDAAMTLVPEGFKWKLGYSRFVPHVAELRDYRGEPRLGMFIGEHDHSRAIALCIAALRARSQ
jgi:hypothetical protein